MTTAPCEVSRPAVATGASFDEFRDRYECELSTYEIRRETR